MGWTHIPFPSEWDTQSGTEAGLVNGTWYTPKYGDSAHSVRRKKYDIMSQTFTNFYYYWVPNKLTVPNMEPKNN